jgi:hypothetical protein
MSYLIFVIHLIPWSHLYLNQWIIIKRNSQVLDSSSDDHEFHSFLFREWNTNNDFRHKFVF